MAITSFDISCDINRVPMKSSSSAISSKGGNSCRLLKINIATDRSLSSAASKRNNKAKKNISRSPYLASDRVQLLSRVTEKRMVHKKTTDIVSSFPLAVNLYKASSDEFKSPKKVKKVKKSVLTLPNDPAPTPQVCTVSDINESEYCENINQDRKQKVIKKRIPNQNNRKTRGRQKDFEFYDRDARFCPQLNIDLDCSSTDMLKNFNGDGYKVFKKKSTFGKPQPTASSNLSDVWSVLRNINKFQFRPSPPVSEESTIALRSKSQKRQRRLNHKDARVIETCHTEEFAYISSYEMDDKSPRSFSPSSSADRITVIDKKSQFSKICKELEKRILKTQDFLKDRSNTDNVQIKSPKTRRQCRSPKKNLKALTSVGTKEYKPKLKKKKKKAKRPVDQQSKSAPTNSSGNRDSLVDAETLQINYNSDVSSHKTETTDSMRPTKDISVFSDYSGSSKAELPSKQDEQECIDDKLSHTQKSIERSGLLVNQSSPAKENKEQVLPACSTVPKQCDPPKRKPRLVTTMPSSCIMPKLTQTEIKRRLANIRFPIVILGKDQVSSGIKVIDYDPPQFSGLDEHIWPFMKDWSTNTMKDATHHNNTLNKKCVSFVSDTNSSKSHKTHIEMATHRQSPTNYKEKKTTTIKTVPTNKKKTEIKHPPSADISEKILQCSKKQKSIVQLKDKMLNFLYKKTPNRTPNSNINENSESTPKSPIITENKLVTTDIQVRPTDPLILNDVAKRKALPSSVLAVRRNKKPQNYTYPWAKAKWASDFIENVIKKIRNGVYYSQEHKDFSQIFPIDYKEVSVQTGLPYAPSDSTQTYDSDTALVHELIDPPPSIPGFNQTLPVLEIKTLNINQIAVKHCVTNVIVQFDVTGPDNAAKSATSLNKNIPLIPLEVTNSHTKVFKCKTTILNGMLPAEICSILPKMMNNIINSTNTNVCTYHPCTISPTKTESCLSTITEQARSKNAEPFCLKVLNRASKSEMRIFEGSFPHKDYQIKPILQKYSVKIDFDSCVIADLLPLVSLDDLLQYEVGPLAVELDSCKFAQLQLTSKEPKKLLEVTETVQPTYTDLATYTDGANRMTSAFSSQDLTDIMKSLWYNYNLQIYFNLSSYFEMLKLQYDGQNIKLNMSMVNYNGAQENIAVTVSNVKIDSLFKAISKGNVKKTVRNKAPLKCIEYVNTMLANKTKGTEVGQVTLSKVKRKGFYKLYRKCKSTTNIPIISGDKNPNTPLNKITTLDEFFQVLGSKKLLSSVFDGYSSDKILSSIIEMKNWITEINAKQALLILLLTNKKDTQNLVRFRPIILQGIAVNRITRATELDMEIEVIERENLNKFSQYEGISYLPASVTNYDNLLEELYWIAKTTASDYQRPFDESSERLLKSLLEKRKKLNPSYLRVMARYVGLGLLKPPAKC